MRVAVCLFLIAFVQNSFGEDLDKLSWLSGAWAQAKSSSKYTTLIVSNLKDGRLIATESIHKLNGNEPAVLSFENFEIREGSPIELQVYPQGQKSFVLKAILITLSKVVFENKKHDFPQRWSFKLLKDGSLLETAEGNGQKIELKFHRSKKK